MYNKRLILKLFYTRICVISIDLNNNIIEGNVDSYGRIKNTAIFIS